MPHAPDGDDLLREQVQENARLRERLAEAQETLEAILSGEVDTLVVRRPAGHRLYALDGVERAYRKIVDTMQEAALTLTPEGTISYCNRSFARLVRVPLEQGLERSLTDFLPPSQHPALATLLDSTDPAPPRQLFSLQASDGRRVPIQVSASRLEDEPAVQWVLVLTDLTELEDSAHLLREVRHQREAAEQNRLLLRSFFDSSPLLMGLAECDGDRTFLIEGNAALSDLLRVQTGDGALAEQRPLGWTAALDRQWVDALLACKPGASPASFELRIPGGDADRCLSVTSVWLGQRPNHRFWFSFSAEDVTARRQMEAALRESEARLRLFIEHAPLALAMFDREMRYLVASARWRTDYGLGSTKLTGRSHYEVFPEIPEHWKAIHRRGLAGETVQATDDRFVRADGSVQWVQWVLCPWFDPAGQVGGIAIFTEDITTRKTAERALQDSEERLRRLGDNLPHSAVYQYVRTPAGQGRFLYVSAGIERLTGVCPAAVLADADTLHRQLPPDDLARLLAAQARSQHELSDLDIEVPIHRSDGELRWMHLHSRPRRLADGRTLWDGVQNDITAHKRMFEAVRRHADLLRLSQDAILVWTFDGGIETWNRGAEVLYGFAAAQAQGRVAHDLLRTRLPTAPAEFEAALQRRRDWEGELAQTTRDGRGVTVWARMQVIRSDDGIDRVLESNRDITDRKEAQEHLRDSEARLRLALDAAHMGAFDWDMRTNRVLWSRQHEVLFGLQPGEFDGTTAAVARQVHPEDLPRLQAEVARCVAVRKPLHCDYRVTWPDGSLHWLNARGEFLFDPSGRPISVHGVVLEFTERKRAEQNLRRFKEIVEHSSEMLLFVGADLRYQVVNPAYAAACRTTPEALYGRRVDETAGPGSQVQLMPALRAALAGEPQQLTLQGIDPDGQWRWIETTLQPFVEEGKVQGLIASLHDQTDLREAQAALEAERAHLEERVAERTAELKRSESKLRTIYDLLPIGIAITDPVGRLVDCNPASERLLGRSRTEYCQRTDAAAEWQVVRLDGSPMPREEYADVRAMQEDQVVRDVEMGIVRTDDTVWVSVSAMPSSHPDYGVIIAYVDISARKHQEARIRDLLAETQVDYTRLRRQQETLRMVLAAAPIAVRVATLADHRALFMNQSFCRLVRRTPEEAANLDISCHYVDRSAFAQIVRRVQQGEFILNHLVELKVPDQPAVPHTWALASYMGIDYEGEPAVLAWLFDVTPLREAQAAAEGANRAKSAFLAHMSHEIRTPMNGIIGLSELALQRPLDPTTRGYLEHLHQSARNLMGILNDILDQSKIDAGLLQLDHVVFDPADLLDRLRLLFAPSAAARGLALVIAAAPELPRALLGDPLRLQQVLANLLSNAIKFTAQGQVSLAVGGAARMGSQVRLSWTVADTGIGIAADNLPGLFDPFVQGDPSIARRFGGTGLGLSISRRLARLMGGELRVASTPDHGSTFTLELPFDMAAAPAGPAPVSPALAPAPVQFARDARILVAEDLPVNQLIIADMLRLLGVEATLAPNGREALERLRETAFDLVLMDIQMPDMDGLTATRHIRQNPAWAELPVIALTAGVTEAERAQMHACGMNDLLAKPVTLATLTAILGHWLPPVPNRPQAQRIEWFPAAPNPDLPRCVSNADAPLTLQGFDLQQLFQLLGGVPQVTQRLALFADTIRADAQAIAEAMARDDPAAVAGRAHRLKGAAGAVGATALYAAAARLEEALCQAPDPSPALAALCEAQAAALAQIDALPRDEPAQTDATVTLAPADLAALLGEVQAQIADRLVVSPHLLERLKAVRPIAAAALIQALDQFDYAQAERRLALLIADDPFPMEPAP